MIFQTSFRVLHIDLCIKTHYIEHMINPGKAGLFCRYRHSSPNNFFSVRDMSNNVYIERKLRFWRLRISARQSGIRAGKVESDEIPIQVKNVIFRFSQENIVIFALRSN